MLIIFKSAASGDVITLEENGKAVLTVLNKDAMAAQGIVTVAQLPEAISRLRAAIDADVLRQLCRTAEPAEDEEREPVISFRQRSLPVLELLERSLADKVPVTWGV